MFRIAAATLVVLSSVVACGRGSAQGVGTSAVEAGSRDPSGFSTPGQPWSEADLNAVAVTAEDLDGYEMNRAEADAGGSRMAVDPATCGPIAQAMSPNGSAYAATARIARFISPEGDGSGATMTLASHSAEDARLVLQEFRRAAERCTAFTDIGTSWAYEAVEVQPDPDTKTSLSPCGSRRSCRTRTRSL